MPIRIDSPYFFVNPHGKLAGKHYALATTEDIWNMACKSVDEDIDMYSGLKHSSCSQYINEKHYSFDQVQMLTDHKNVNLKNNLKYNNFKWQSTLLLT